MSGIIMGISAVGSLAYGIGSKIHANNKKKQQDKKTLAAANKLKQFEQSRQPIIDQSGKIRDLKSQVKNPYENLAVANQASELQIEQTDQALANTLDQINQSGTGAGVATAMARMAAASKAQVGASLENQEVQNQKLRAEGQASADAQKMQIEQAALGAEESAWGRQEDRDLSQLDRLSGLQENSEQQSQAYQMQGDAAMMSGIQGALGTASAIPGAMDKKDTFTNKYDPNTGELITT
jgi:hypothetical protein